MTLTLESPPDLPGHLVALVRQIPRGRVATYGRLAETLGSRMAAKWIGQFLLYDPRAKGVPAHRVVRSDGSLGRYHGGSLEQKRQRLVAEGVSVSDEHVDVERYGFHDFKSERPLHRLRKIQERLLDQVRLEPLACMPRLVAGVDVSYRRRDGRTEGIATYALIDWETRKPVWSTSYRREVTFPYISSFLAFRELPLLSGVIHQAIEQGHGPELVLVDGSGILHQRHAGIATHLGIVLDLPTIGVTKKRLHGKMAPPSGTSPDVRRVTIDGQTVGLAIAPTPSSRKPLFVSPGHRVDVPSAAQVVRHLLRGHRLPEPIYWADRLSRQQARHAK